MRIRLLSVLPIVVLLPVTLPSQQQALTPHDSALHALNRLAYGARPGEVARVASQGVMAWIDRQLAPERIADGVLAERERGLAILDYDPRDPAAQRGRRLVGEFQELAVMRAVLSERQLYEVMVDFWTNHFNVYLAKGADRFLTPDYIEHTIRPHAMGRFEDLLIATARSPAMLFYLDNWQSIAPGATPPPALFRRRGGQGAKPMPQGLNENYARELLELHTLGVDGGYTQQDVVAVARIFTGWSIGRPRQGGDFEFR